MFKPLKISITFFAAAALVACASSPRPPSPPSGASCYEHQNYCIDMCKRSFDSSDLINAFGALASTLALKPKTQKDRDALNNSSTQENNKTKKSFEACKETCDIEADQCRKRRS
jgi:hypothetical protein